MTKCRCRTRKNGFVTTSHLIAPLADAEAEVVPLLQDLIRIDSTNYGDGSGPGEVAAADYVHQRLLEVGYAAERFNTTAEARSGVVVRVPGSDASADKFLVHAHLDVVPAVGDWTHAPFGGEIADGMVWGRGAVDMKDGVATILACLRSWARNGVQPRRETVFVFLPDEEAGGVHGSQWVAEHRTHWFEGVTECVGEVGGFSFEFQPGRRMYLIETAEKGLRWMKLRASGRAGHGSMLNDNNAVVALAEVLARSGATNGPFASLKQTSASSTSCRRRRVSRSTPKTKSTCGASSVRLQGSSEPHSQTAHNRPCCRPATR